MEHVDLGGLRVAYHSRGAGRPLVLLHGGVCDGRVFAPQLDDLSDRFRVVAWDAPGCGGSSDPPGSFRLSDFADVLAGFVAALDLDRPHVLGHSWGSGLAIELVDRHPGLVSSLVLAGGYAGWAGSLPADEVAERLRAALDLADRLPDGFDPTSIPGLFSDVMPPQRRAALATVMSDIRPTGTRVMARAFAEADLRDALGRVTVPTLLLHGADDARSPFDVADALHRAIAGSELVVMDGLGHEAFSESASTFDAHVRAFLDRVDAAGG
ncbi:MAG: alpha/beta hydrolase [Actinomycetota bacterium]|nr:alpha/beta hydrolase [Actinomycetota bacterium]